MNADLQPAGQGRKQADLDVRYDNPKWYKHANRGIGEYLKAEKHSAQVMVRGTAYLGRVV